MADDEEVEIYDETFKFRSKGALSIRSNYDSKFDCLAVSSKYGLMFTAVDGGVTVTKVSDLASQIDGEDAVLPGHTIAMYSSSNSGQFIIFCCCCCSYCYIFF